MEKDKNFAAKVAMAEEAVLAGFSMVCRDALIIPVPNQKKRTIQEVFSDKTKCRQDVERR